MRYTEFRDQIRRQLRRSRRGLTWAELRDKLALPYDRPCPTWVKELEKEIGLVRSRGEGRALVWTLADGSSGK